jgi:uncharacterized protein YeaO (DUF488 family)
MASVRQGTATGSARRVRASSTVGAVRIKRAYDEPDTADGYRVLVDRLWPRGVRKDALVIDAWMKDLGPSHELRRWFGHDPARWNGFATRYRGELRREPAAGLVAELAVRASHRRVTLVYGSKDELHNQAVVLQEAIEQRLRRDRAQARVRKSIARRARAVVPSGRPRVRATRRGGRQAALTRRSAARTS